jgi:hypothetical protein
MLGVVRLGTLQLGEERGYVRCRHIAKSAVCGPALTMNVT